MYTLLCVLVYVVACICVTIFVLYVIREEIREDVYSTQKPKIKKRKESEKRSRF